MSWKATNEFDLFDFAEGVAPYQKASVSGQTGSRGKSTTGLAFLRYITADVQYVDGNGHISHLSLTPLVRTIILQVLTPSLSTLLFCGDAN